MTYDLEDRTVIEWALDRLILQLEEERRESTHSSLMAKALASAKKARDKVRAEKD